MQDDDPIGEAQALLEQRRAPEALALLNPLLQSGRAGLLARFLYARAAAAAGDTSEALRSARETALLYPGIALASLGLGEALLRDDRLPAAIAEIQRALRIDPASVEARFQLGCAWLQAGEPEKALREFGQIPLEHALAELPAKIAEANEMRMQPRSNAYYVRHLFDQFSADYDERMLGQLGYAAPQILRELFLLVSPGAQPRSLRILDLGCGTGLAGLAFAPFARVLDGVDLSPSMLEKARVRDIYSSLRLSDIEEPPSAPGAYDLILAADTLVYLGELGTVLSRAHTELRPDALFLFTVEFAEGDGFALGPKRRWRHSEPYLREAGERHGFGLAAILQCQMRSEAGQPVQGYAVALRKTAPQPG